MTWTAPAPDPVEGPLTGADLLRESIDGTSGR